jgi:serine/threonine protein kinase
VLEKLGEGGMGEVYLAEDSTLGREVALKVLPEAFTADPERLARFEREARVLAALDHPKIASIYSFEAAKLRTPITGDLPPAEGGREGEPGPQAPRPAEQVVHFLIMQLAELAPTESQ